MKSRMREICTSGSVRGVGQTSHINKIRKRGKSRRLLDKNYMKMIKKIISLLLIIAILINNFEPFIVVARDNGNSEDINLETINRDEIVSKGNIEVELHLALPIRNVDANDIEFKIIDDLGNNASLDLNEVNKPADGYYRTSLTLGKQTFEVAASERDKDGHILSGINNSENVVYISINLYNLNKGTYTLEFRGKHFATYKVDVTLDDYSKRVMLSDEAGLLAIGDVNNDEIVDENDYALLRDNLESNNLEYDLNLDGVVDIADLNYITASINSDKKTVKIENTNAIINAENVSFDINDDVLAPDSASVSALFSDEGVVKLQQIDDNPIELGINLSGNNNTETIKMSEVRITVGENAPVGMKLRVETEDGEIILKDVNNYSNIPEGIHLFTDEAEAGTIKVDLGKQVAVKKVTIVITETGENNLAEIAKVEFLNNVKVQTKEPDNFYTPAHVTVDDSVSEQLTITFDNVPNVTGYEIEITGGKMNGTIFQTTYTTFTIEDLENYTEYAVRVQSVNQEWRSGFSEVVKATPKANRKPPAPDMVNTKALYGGIEFSWKDMKDTLTYNIYYHMINGSNWTKIENITTNKYTLKGLKGNTEYEAYITGNNPLGEGAASQTVKVKTLEETATITPKYNLINSYDNELGRTNHINNVTYSKGNMVGGNYAMYDDNYQTYWEIASWQSGSHYYEIGYPIFELDNTYKMDEFVITVPDSYPYSLKSGSYRVGDNDTLVYYWNKEETPTAQNKSVVNGVLSTRTDENGRKYYVLKLDEPIEADAIQFGLTVVGNGNLIQIDEVKFYNYDSLVDDVAKLFVDDLRVELADGVTIDTITNLRNRANTMNNGEYSPYRDSVLNDLDYAEKILNDEKLNDVVVVNPNISNSYNGHLKFAMTINDYQPLGIVARPGDTLNVYVGSTTGNVNIELVYTQFYAEASTWSKTYSLTKGQNIIKIEAIGSATSERGGSVYVRYTSMPHVDNQIKVRVSGGEKIPVLDLSKVEENNKKDMITNYIQELNEYTNSLNDKYAKENKAFDKKTSVLNATEIVTKYGIFSVAATAVKEALDSKASEIAAQVDVLYESTEAFDEMMELFYRQKGLKVDAEDAKDEMPKARINIRYMRMFDGAFMYAGGYHIGIEYGSIPGLIQASRNSDDKTGYFGWGISHEIGHQINQKDTVFAEVTNNIYALLAQTSNDKDKSRLELSNIYEKIYDKVTSHTNGRAQNVFVQLGMYWQLHLAYDKNKTFDDEDSILARVNHIARTYENVNKYSRDELTILYASMASGKDLTDFFEAWGLKVSATLKDELSSIEVDGHKLEKEDRAIYYLNDKARRYIIGNGEALTNSNILEASIASQSNEEKRVTINFKVTTEENKILGYEIIRNGVAIGFVTDANTFTDIIGAENNRAYTYSVVAYDYYLNKTNTVTLEEVKITHDGSVKKDKFIISSNVKEIDEVIDNENEEIDFEKLKVNNLIDGDISTGFRGTEKIKVLNQTNDNPSIAVDNGNAYVIINLNNPMAISGIKYHAIVENGVVDANTIRNYKVYVSSDGNTWTIARTGTFNVTVDNPEEIIYFMGEGTDSESQLWTYNDVAYVKIEADGNKNGLSGAEIDVIAPPGDNVDFGEEPIGILKEDYCYLVDGCTDDEKVKAGSVIIHGNYRGNPSFNNVLIADGNNEKKPYKGQFIIFAELNSDKSVYEVANGSWIYIMCQDEYEQMRQDASSIRAYLYRVNDAVTLDGQRLTSTSKVINDLKPYSELSYIEISSITNNN